MTLPKGVQRVVNRHGRPYYFYAPRRGTKSAGQRIPLGSDVNDPEFWRRLRDAKNPADLGTGTLSALIVEYKTSHEWSRLRPASLRGYTHFLDRLDAEGVTARSLP